MEKKLYKALILFVFSLLANNISAQCSGTGGFTVSSPLCVNQPVTFIDTGSATPDSVLWRFKNNGATYITDTVVKSYSSAQTDTVWLIRFFNTPSVCSDTVFQVITVTAVSAAFSPSVNQNICDDDSVILSATTAPGISYQWQQAGANIGGATDSTLTVKTTGTYRLVVTQNGCADTSATVNVNVYSYPTANFTFSPDSICSGSTVSFTNTSGGNSLSYQWSFGNGTTSTATNPTNVYDTSGTRGIVSYTVRLITTTPGNCGDTITKTVYVRRRPNSAIDDFNNIPKFVQCNVSNNPFSLQIDNISTTTSTNSAYTIDWGDGNSQNFSPPFDTVTHVYATSGAFVMTVTTTDSAGCPSVATYNVFNGGNPGVSIGNSGSTSGCRPYDLIFTIDTSKSSGIGNNAVGTTYTLTFNDGSAPLVYTHPPPTSITKTFLTPSCGVATPGFPNAFQAEMVVTNPCGTNSATIRPIYISTKPEAEIEFDPDSDTACLNVPFTINDVSDTGSVSSGTGCNQTPRRLWSITPNTGWTLNSGYFGNHGNWNNNPANWGSQSLQVDFSDTGVYTVQLIVGNIAQAGLSVCGDDTIERIVRIFRPPLADFTLNVNPVNGCANSNITTNNTSTGDNLSFQWIISPNTGYTVTSGSLTSANPTFQFTTAGTYLVTLIGSNQCDQDTLTDTLVIRDVPIASMLGPAEYCGPDTITYDTLSSNLVHRVTYNTNLGDTVSYVWTVTGGAHSFVGGDSTSYNSTIILEEAGTYTVQVTITNECGSDVATQTVTINPLPEPDFTVNDSAQCFNNNNFIFTNASAISSGTIVSYNWDFGDGATSTNTNPTHSYGTVDTFDVKLIVTSNNGCVDSVTRQMIVFPEPVAAYNINDTDQCLNGNSFVFTNTSTVSSGSNTYLWKFTSRPGDTSILANPTFVYDTVGVFAVKLITTTDNGCIDSVTRNVYVRPAPEPDFTVNDTTQCLNGNSFEFTNTSTILSGSLTYKWIFSTAADTSVVTDPTKVYTTADTFDVKLIATSTFGCIDSITHPVYVFPKPDMDFTVNDSAQCFNGHNFIFTNNSSIASGTVSYKWQFSSNTADTSILTNPTKTYSTSGAYPVKLIGTSDQGCKDSTSHTMTVYDEPLPGFTINDTTQCLNGNSFSFTDTSVVGGAYSRQWTFGDGGSSTTASPTHSYATEGTYTVKLVVTIGLGGCKDSVEHTVYVYPKPNPAFTVDDSLQCFPGNAFGFTNGTTIASGTSTYLWKFDAPSNTDTSTQTDASKSYATDGSFVVRLIATSDQGCKDSTQKTVTVNPIIVNNNIEQDQGICAGFAPDSLKQFGVPVGGGDGSFTYQWQESTDSAVWTDIGGATGVNYQPPVLTANRWYRRVVVSGSCADTSSPVKITVTPAVTTNTIAANQIICEGFSPAQFTGSTPTGGVGTFTYQWQASNDSLNWSNIGGATDTNYQSGALTLTTFFRRRVISGVCSQPGNTIKVLVNPKPVVSFTTASVCFGFNASFTSTSTIASGSITNYNWNFGDGNNGTGSSPSHGYAAVGAYTIKLIATSDSGCVDSTTLSINVSPKPVAAFTSNDTCLGFGNNFNATGSTVSSGSITLYNWNFADATTGSGATISKTYASHGTYNVKLIVTTDSSCKDSITQAVIVHPRPVPNFTVNDSDQCVNGNNFAYTNATTIASGSSTYLWNLGESTTDTTTQTNASKTYAANGNYDVKLIATSNFGCVDSITKTMIVYAKPAPAYAINDTDQCLNGNSFVFTNGSTVNPIVGLTYVWTFGDGNSSTLTNPTHSYTTEGTYTVKVVVTSVNGCKDSISKTVYVYPKPNPDFTINDTLQCFSGNLFVYTNTSTIASGTQTYAWKLNLLDATDTSTQTDVNRTYTTSGNLTVRLTATSNHGCKDSIQKNITVKPDITNNNIAPTQNVCSGSEPDTLQHTGTAINGGDGTFTYQWQQSTDSVSWSDVGGATTDKLAPGALFATTWYRRVAVSGPCSDTSAPIKITVTPGIGNNIISSSQTQCAGFTPAQFTGTTPTGGSGVYGYQWQISTDSAVWTDISGATDSVFQAGFLNQTTWYRRKASSNSCTVISIPVKVNVNPKPVASFTAPSTCLGVNANFNSTSTIASGSIVQYNWTFGDGNTATGTPSPQNGYASVGSYVVKLVVTSDSGCVDSTTRTVWVNPKPVASFVFNDTCQTYSNNFDATASSVSSGSIAAYNWNFDDATTGTGATTIKTYAAVGAYDVKLIVTTDSACKDSITQTVTVHPNPVVAYTANDTDQCVNGNNFIFTNGTTIASGTVTYNWNFGESATDTSTLTDPTKVYSLPFTYDVELVATSNFGCRDTVTHPMVVYTKPTPVYTVNDTDQCINGNSFVFTNGSFVAPGIASTYLWDFGDGDTSTQANPTKSYVIADTFAVKLVVTSVNGCVDSIVQNVYVRPKPSLDFDINDSLQCFGPNLFTFTNQTVISSGSVTYLWKFNVTADPADTSVLTNPTKSYPTDGTYTVRMIATSDFGCKDSAQNQIIIKPDIVNNDISGDQFLCEGQTPDTIRHGGGIITGGDGTFGYQWQQTTDSSTWTDIVGATDTIYVPPTLFTTTWYRRIISSGPCSDTSVIVKIGVTPSIGNNSITASQVICAGLSPAKFVGSLPTGGSGTYNYQWQISPDSINWSDMGGATDTSYQETVLTQTRYYRRRVTSGSCPTISDTIKVTVNPKPSAVFTTASVCFGFDADFVSSSSVSAGSIVQTQWKYGDGDTGTGTPSTHNYAAAGAYTPQLIVTTDQGCKDSTTRPLNIFPKPAAAFTHNDTCFSFQTSFSATTTTVATGSIADYSWDLSDGATATGISANHTYSAVGSYNVKLIVTSDSACTDSVTNTVVIHPNPVAAYTVNDSDQCLNGNNFVFTNGSSISAGANTYRWTFGQSATDTSTQTDPSKVYSANGTFNARLIAVSNFGCTDSVTKQMVVYAKPAQAFNINDTDQCINGNSFTFTNTSNISPAQGLTYRWSFGNGDTSTQTSPTKVYTVAGTYAVKLKVTSVNNCADSVTKNIYVYPKPSPAFTINDTLQCFGPNVFTFTNGSTISSGTISNFWRFDLLNATDTSTQTSPTTTYATDGTFTIRLTNTSDKGCKDSIEKQVTVKPDILNNVISTPQSICQGSIPDTLNQSSSTVSGGDGTFTYQWQQSTDSATWTNIGGATAVKYGPPALNVTTWYRRVVNSGPCADTSAPIKINVTPAITNNVVSSSQTICYAQTPAQLTSTAPGGGNGTFAYLWQQSNNTTTWSTALGTNNTQNYQPGSQLDTIYYRRRIISGSCTTISNVLKITVKPLPVVDWGVTTVCYPEPSVFSDSSTVNQGSNVAWSWDFGDGTTSTQQNPSKIYTAGTYSPKLIVTTNFGCKDSLTGTVIIYPKPQAGYRTQDNCYGFASTFTDTAKVSSGSVVGWNWNFGDAFTSSAKNPNHTYFTYGTYNVRQIVTTDRGCKDTVTKAITIHPKPAANFGASTECYPDSSSFTDSSTVALGSITNWAWAFGDGNTSTLTNPKNQYASDGVYVSKLVVTSDKGCTDSLFKAVTVYPLPVVAFTGDTLECTNKTIFYNNSSSGGSTYAWSYGDGGTSTGSVGTHTYTTAGNYTVVLVATSAFGCVDSTSRPVHIVDAPSPSFTLAPDTGCAPLNVAFTNNSTGYFTTYDWNFGNGTGSTLYSPGNATYIQSSKIDSVYVITLNATNACGTRTARDTVTVFPKPVANFAPNSPVGCSPQVFSISNNTTAFPDSYLWDFGNGVTSTSPNPPAQTYTTTDSISIYTITLRVDNHCGFDTAAYTVTVYPKPQAGFSTADNCFGFASTFTDSAKVGTGAITSWAYTFGDGNSSGAQNPSRTYASFGTYNVTQIVTTNNGCKDTLTKQIVIHPKPAAKFGATTNCYPDSTVYTDSSTVALGSLTNWVWAFGDGNTSTQTSPKNQFASYGTYTSKLVVTSDKGCKDSVSKTVTVHPLPSIAFSGDTLECTNKSLVYSNTSSGAASFVWNYGDGATSTGSVGSHTYTNPGNYRVVLVGTTAFGCVDSSEMMVHIISPPTPTFTLVPDTGCGPLQVNFTNNSTGLFTTYDWNFGNGTTSTLYSPAAATYQQSRYNDSNYYVVLSATNICGTQTARDTVTVFPKPVAGFTRDVVAGCSPLTVTFTNATTAFPSTHLWDFGDGTTSTAATPPAHVFTTTSGISVYTVSLRVANHCGFDTITHTITVYPKPQAGFSTADNCNGFVSSFTDSATVSAGSIASWAWTFGDGNISAAQNPTLTYTNHGTYSVTQIITTDFGCKDTVTHPITIHPKPVAKFGATTVCFHDTTQFTDSSTVALGSLTNWAWTFGDGNSSSTQNPKNLYPSYGGYTTKLIVTSDKGCKDSVAKTVTVTPLPTIAFNGDTLSCANQSVSFTNNSSNAASYVWKYGDGNTSTGSVGSNTYTTPGFYTITLVGTSSNGCIDSASMVVHIMDVPAPAFTLLPDTGCAPLQVNFANNSTGLYTSYDWNFGNGQVSTQTTPATVTYQQSNYNDTSYYVVLSATNMCGTRTARDTVTVFPKPVAKFATNITAGCSPQSFTFTNNSTAFPDTYLWDFGDGTTSTAATPPSHTYSTGFYDSTYTIHLRVSNHCGFDTVSHNITVYPQPIANFTFTDNCNGFASNFMDSATVGTGNIAGWAWTLGDGNTSTAQNPTRTYTTYGTYNVTQIVTTNRGCKDTITKPITIHPKPVVKFGATTVCDKDSTSYTDSSTVALGNITNWAWTFGDGNTSTQTNPKNLYASYGAYTTKLVLTTDKGCKDSLSKVVTVNPLPVISFVGDTLECANKTVQYSNTSTGAATYAWNYGDGNTSTSSAGSNTFAATGFYRVVLVGTTAFGCKDSAEMTVHIMDVPTPAFTLVPDTGCGPLQVNFTNNSTGLYTNYDWNFGNGASSTQANPSAVTFFQSNFNDTSYYVVLSATNMCGTRTARDTVTVFPKPVARFTRDLATGCSPLTVTFTNGTTAFPSTHFWDFDDGTTSTAATPPAHVFTTTSGISTYHVRLRVANHCGFDTVTHTVIVYPKPVAGFGTVNNCFGFASNFTDSTTVSAGSITNWAWTFGDGNISSAQNPANSYNNYGTYSVTQIVTTDFGCKDTVSHSITIHPKPVAKFGANTVCFHDSTSFTDSSTVALGSLTNWAWRFGDGNTSTQTNPKNLYPSYGSYTTKLVVTSNQGCQDSVAKTITVAPLPTMAFNGDTLSCANQTVTYTNNSTGAASYVWKYGDGNTSTGSVGSNIFTTPGFYTVTLIGTSSNGCIDSTSMVVHIMDVPNPAFTLAPDTGCAPLQVNFANNSTGLYTSYDWNFGNGLASTQTNPSAVTYFQSNYNDTQYYVVLSATNMCGTRTVSDTVTVFPKPVASFTRDIVAGCSPQSFTFTSTSTAFPGTYLWDFDDGTTSTAANPPAHVFTTTNGISVYYVKLRVANHCGFDTISHTVTVYPKPVAGFISVDNCNDFASNFTDTATVSAGSIASWAWTFGDGNISSAQNPNRTYTNHGTYNVTQIVTSDRGCKDTVTQPITIHPKPVAKFGATTVCFNDSTSYTDSSTVALGTLTNWLWTFGDGNSSTSQNPKNVYPSYGAYTTKLIVTSDRGCRDSIAKTVSVTPLPVIAFSADTLACVNQTVLFSNTTTGAATFAWKYGDGNTSTGSAGSNTYSAPGFYTVTLTGTSSNGCVDSASIIIHVIDVPAPAFTVLPDTGCAPLQVNFVNNSTGLYTTYDWDFGNTQTSTQATPAAVTYQQSLFTDTIYIITLRATNICGTRSAKDTVTIFPKPLARFSTNVPNGCSPTAFTMIDNSAAYPDTYLWDFGDGTTSTLANPPAHTYSAGFNDTTYTIRLRVANHCGFDTVSHTITVFPQPVANFGTANNCYGFASNFTDSSAVGTGAVTTWNWAFGDGNTATSKNPAHSYLAHGTYNVRLIATTNRGCKDTSIKPIIIHPQPVANFGVSTECYPDSSQFTDSSTVALGTVTGWEWTFGDGNTSTLQNPKNAYAANGNYTAKLVVTSNQGCKDSILKPVTVHPLPQIAFRGDTLECTNRSVFYSNSSTGAATYVWNYGDGNTSTGSVGNNVYANPGYYRVVLVGRTVYGCEDSAAMTVHIIGPPTPAFTILPDSGCAPLNVNFVNNSIGEFTSYDWDFGNGTNSTQHTPATVTYVQSLLADTLYLVTVRATNICATSSLTDDIRVYPKPVANFGTDITSGCTPKTFTITNTSTGFPNTYFWDFDDGTTSTAQTPPPHTFTTDSVIKTYVIRLRVENQCGFDTVSRRISVLPKNAKSFFGVDTLIGCAPLTVNITDFSVGATTVNYDFDDGNSSALRNPTHTFINPGTYRVRQFISNDCTQDTSERTITVVAPPSVSFTKTPTAQCRGVNVQFQSVATGVTGYHWDFGNGDTSTFTNPAYSYPVAGTYTVTLTVTAAATGCVNSYTDSIIIHAPPVPVLNTDTSQGCPPLNVNFTDGSAGSVFVIWKFGDGNTSSVVNPLHTYTTTGVYTARMVVRNAQGCEDSVDKLIQVHPVPVAGFTQTSTYCDVPSTVNFTNTSTGATSYFWDFGNSLTSSINSPSVQYNNFGIYTTVLRATNQFGCQDTASATFEVFRKPITDISLDTNGGCAPVQVNFTTNSQFATSYLWDFGDGNTSTQQNPTHTYTTAGAFNVTLKVISGGGCTDSLQLAAAVTVYPIPVAGFDVAFANNNTPNYGEAKFTDQSQNANTYLWDFGDGGTSTIPSPIHRYDYTGNYLVTQYITTNQGCMDTAEKWIEVPFFSGLFVPNAFTPGAGGPDVRIFMPVATSLKKYRIGIYDTWGKLLWQSTALRDTKPAEGWDGTHDGKECQQDVYVWKIEAEFLDGSVWKGLKASNGRYYREGTVTLLR